MDSHKTDDAERGDAPLPGAAPATEPEASLGTERDVDDDRARSPEEEAETSSQEAAGKGERAGSAQKKKAAQEHKNNVRKIRMEKMMSKAELARRAGMSTLTIDRVERGLPCRMDTKRKILEALGLKPSDRVLVFGEDD